MAFFTQVGGSRLFAAAQGAQDRGWAGYLLPPGTPPPEDGIDIPAALAVLPGSFVFATTTPPLADPDRLIEALDAVIQGLPVSRAIMWLPDPAAVVPAAVPACGLSDDGATVRSRLTAPIVADLTLVIPVSATVSVDGEALKLVGLGSQAAVAFGGGSAPQPSDALQVDVARLALSGPSRGCAAFDLYIRRRFLLSGWSWGFQLAMPGSAGRPALATTYPLASASPATGADLIGFSVLLDPADPLDTVHVDVVRSALGFSGVNYDDTPTTLASWFVTTTGEQITLRPTPAALAVDRQAARLVFNPGVGGAGGNQVQQFQVAPGGDFLMSLASGGTDGEGALLCGLSGTEAIAFAATPADGQGDRLRFSPANAAFVARYPLAQATRTGPVVQAEGGLLDDRYPTSWTSVVAGPALPATYVSQPGGATLYGRGGPLNGAHPTLLDASEGGSPIPASAVFPMLPYAAVVPGDGLTAPTAETIQDLERLVVAPTRRVAIGPPSQVFSSRRAALADGAPPPTTTTTPAGLLVTVDGGTWSKVLLGQNDFETDGAIRSLQMCLCHPTPSMQQALSSSELFLVATDPKNLGVPAGAGDGSCGPGPAFFNRLNIDRWLLAADVGLNRVGDYTNVMIIKGRRGALWDASTPESRRDSLISNPQKWTQAEDFGPPGPELTALSYWLQAYFEDARTQVDADYFEQFNAIAADPAWTGILMLRVTIAELPTELAGIIAGISTPDAFYAHHFAVQISQIANDPKAPQLAVNGPSSMFGLIHYVDPDFTEPAPGSPAEPLAPTPGVEYDFRVLSLKALFANSTVSRFQSSAQITFNRLFGTSVTAGPGGPPYDAYDSIVLAGAYQSNNGRPVYSLASQADSMFALDGNIMRRVELTGVQMTTREPGDAGGADDTVTWFALEGFIDFTVMTAAGLPFDLLAYGNEDGADAPRKGLSFSGLGLQMTFPPDDPTQRTFAFATNEIAFDAGTSTPRPGSLFEQFALELNGLTSGTAESPPDKQGFLRVVTDATLRGVSASALWYGLQFRCNLGSPGKLAGDAGLTSTLLVAWAPDSSGDGSYDALVGLQLPGTSGGASLISLENVLKLSIGQLLLTYDRGSTTPPQRPGGFLLMLSEISLRLLGLLKLPPNGATSFFVFGDPQGRGKPSGLGWYAVYRKAPAKPAADAARPGELTC